MGDFGGHKGMLHGVCARYGLAVGGGGVLKGLPNGRLPCPGILGGYSRMNISPAQIRHLENGQESRLGTQRNGSKWGVVPPDMKALVLYHNSLLLARLTPHELTGRFNNMHTAVCILILLYSY